MASCPHLTAASMSMIVATVALTMSTAIAAADSNDDAFLAALESAGIPTRGFDIGPQGSAVGEAKNICSVDGANGHHVSSLAGGIADPAGGNLNLAQATKFVELSEQYYCPQYSG